MKMYLKPIILSNFDDGGDETLDPIGLIGTLTGGDEGGENVLHPLNAACKENTAKNCVETETSSRNSLVKNPF